MNKLTITTAALLTFAACAPAPTLCDRDNIPWDKWGTVEIPAECQAQAPTPMPMPPADDDPVVTPTPDDPEPEPKPEPEPEPEPDTPSDDEPNGGPQGNNGWGNGDQSAPGNSGGNNQAENSGNKHRVHGAGKPN